jgi:hypothetical protein
MYLTCRTQEVKADKMSYPRALGGGPLQGDNLVRIVYLDESGIGGERDGEFIIVGGVIVHGDHQLNKLRVALREVMNEHIPEADRETLVLHAADIYNGNKYFDKGRKPEWADVGRRMALLSALTAIPAKLNLVVVFGLLDKKRIPGMMEAFGLSKPKEILQHVVGLTYLGCLFEVDQWFRQNAKGENCFIVAEDNHDTRQFIKDMQHQHQDPKIPLQIDAEREYLPLRHIHEDPNFQPKRVAHPLILADVISFVVKRALGGDRQAEALYESLKGSMAFFRVKLPPIPFH